MTTSVAAVLPTAPQVLCAIQGRSFEDRTLLRSARALADLHARRVRVDDPFLIAEIDCRRWEVVDVINAWVVQQLPHPPTASALHTESLGTVLDRMARSWVAAKRAIDREGPRSDTAHRRWYHLAQLVDGYTDLVVAVTDGRRRLPDRDQ